MSDTEQVDQYERKRHVLQAALKRARTGGFELGDGHMVVRDNITGNMLGWESWAFSHEFAQAVWGINGTCKMCERPHTLAPWQYHLRELVMADDRIEWLAKELGI